MSNQTKELKVVLGALSSESGKATKREIILEEAAISAFLYLDRAKYLINDLLEQFFELHPSTNKDDLNKIVWQFDWSRAFAETLNEQIRCALLALSSADISRY